MTFGRVAEALPRAIRLVGWPKLVIFFFFFSKVHLNSTGDRVYRTVSLLLALYNSGRRNSFGPELELHTGN